MEPQGPVLSYVASGYEENVPYESATSSLNSNIKVGEAADGYAAYVEDMDASKTTDYYGEFKLDEDDAEASSPSGYTLEVSDDEKESDADPSKAEEKGTDQDDLELKKSRSAALQRPSDASLVKEREIIVPELYSSFSS